MLEITNNKELHDAVRLSLLTGKPVRTTNGVISNVRVIPFANQSDKKIQHKNNEK